ncbi:hypothetical protein BS50DRAFT_641093 [Corynespora cassiicola Philippines]|uniref:Uncharacterized protein n=1 Tax=Corynespora cassiicola Philippines TaxID=1448308 RepID=A0A2T2N1Q2_CORCC|nr:hypothetical protein BS50DRAFT_641093 [Corynespora cassiicola Philippines]
MQPCDTKDNSEIGGPESDGAFHDLMKEAGDDTWMKYRYRGENLLQGMLGTAAQTAQSIWQGDLRQNLKRWYWLHATPSDDAECDFSGGLNQYHEVLHQDDNKKDNQGIVPYHRQKYSVDGKEYHATGAYYKFGINQSDGVIFALYLYNPRTSIEEDALISNKTEPPKLHFFSDILWGYWSHDEKKVKNIRYFVQLSITNTETLPDLKSIEDY